MRLVIARCSVDYAGRLSAHLPLATRLLLLKADGSVLVHSDSLSYKPLNWMSPPCGISFPEVADDAREVGVTETWRVTQAKTSDLLVISIHEIVHDSAHELGIDPGLQKDGVDTSTLTVSRCRRTPRRTTIRPLSTVSFGAVIDSRPRSPTNM